MQQISQISQLIHSHKTWKIYHKSNCRGKNLIYLLDWTCCQKQYIGKSEWPFYIRLNNYRHRIKSMVYNKLILEEQHFHLNAHNFNIDAKSTIIERTFQLIYPSAFFRCFMSNSGWTLYLIHGVDFSNSFNHDQVQLFKLS